jgi:hypothetical protein
MTCVKKIVIASGTLLVVGYLSKPDRGGVGRCAKIFALPELHQLQLSPRPFFAWDLFESPKFRFTISPSDFTKLDANLKAAGYSGWEKGSVTFGSLSVGDMPEEDHIFNRLAKGGYHYHWSYSAKENVIYGIKFP